MYYNNLEKIIVYQYKSEIDIWSNLSNFDYYRPYNFRLYMHHLRKRKRSIIYTSKKSYTKRFSRFKMAFKTKKRFSNLVFKCRKDLINDGYFRWLVKDRHISKNFSRKKKKNLAVQYAYKKIKKTIKRPDFKPKHAKLKKKFYFFINIKKKSKKSQNFFSNKYYKIFYNKRKLQGMYNTKYSPKPAKRKK